MKNLDSLLDLYSVTGNITDHNTLLVNRGELGALLSERDALMADANKLADALMALLAETEHKTHASCTDGGYCPVRDARLALGAWQDAIASKGKEGS
jgi:hypothetical protein